MANHILVATLETAGFVEGQHFRIMTKEEAVALSDQVSSIFFQFCFMNNNYLAVPDPLSLPLSMLPFRSLSWPKFPGLHFNGHGTTLLCWRRRNL